MRTRCVFSSSFQVRIGKASIPGNSDNQSQHLHVSHRHGMRLPPPWGTCRLPGRTRLPPPWKDEPTDPLEGASSKLPPRYGDATPPISCTRMSHSLIVLNTKLFTCRCRTSPIHTYHPSPRPPTAPAKLRSPAVSAGRRRQKALQDTRRLHPRCNGYVPRE